jgi:hypothetical protein
MRELAPGLWHWTAPHEHIKVRVSTYYLQPERVVLDPMIPEEGLVWFEQQGAPEHVVMSNRHHDRHAWQLRDAFGCEVHCIRNGLHEIEGRGPAVPFEFGDELPGGITVHEVGAICPDETALHIPAHNALACADGVINPADSDKLGFVPDFLIDDPERTKQQLREKYAGLLELDFDVLLLAHGDPVSAGGKQALREFTTGGE